MKQAGNQAGDQQPRFDPSLALDHHPSAGVGKWWPLLMLAATAGLLGCGQRGPLYLPTPAPQPPAAVPAAPQAAPAAASTPASAAHP